MPLSNSTKGEAPTVAPVEASSDTSQASKQGTLDMNSTVTTPARAINVPFHGAALTVIEHDGQPYTPMKPIVEGMGLAWSPQRRKMADRFESTMIEMITVAEDGKQRSMTCLPLRKLPGWLNTVTPGKIKSPEVRARVIQYQNECDDVLWQYWNEGLAVNPRAFHVGPTDTLTKDEQDTLRGLIESAAKRLSSDTKEQGQFILKAWSKLKSHFGVTYREIPRQEFTSALSIVTRHEAEFTPITPIPNREPSFDPLNHDAMRHAKEAAQQYFNDFRAGRQAGLDIPPEVLAGIVTEALQRNRMVVTFSQEGNLNARVIAHDKWIFSTAEFIKGIENGDVRMTSEQYARTASACTTKLSGRVEHLEAKLTKPRLEPELRQRIT